jgi:radical SAM protein with 4Fe4S-binding SPASM domain
MSNPVDDGSIFYIDPKKDGKEVFHTYLREAPDSICLYPVSHLNFKIDGAMSCCFRAENLGNIKDYNIEDFWNSEKMKTIRKNMVRGIKSPECANCWRMEESGGFSYRKESITDTSVHEVWRDKFKNLREDGSLPFEVKQAELRFSNVCNLQCRMCSPAFSTKWATDMSKKTELWSWLVENGYYTDVEERLKKSEVPPEKILEFISKSAPHLEYLMITGGEPFIDTTHTKALEILRPYGKNITLEYTTNLNTLTKNGANVLDLWEDFFQVRLKVSVDGDPGNYDYVRYGGAIDAVAANAKKVYERYPIKNTSPYKLFPNEKVVIICTCTVSIYNIARLDRVAAFAIEMGGLFHTSQVNYPQFQSTRVLPKSAKKKITERLTHFIENLDTELDWGNHPLWKTAESRDIQTRRIYRFIKNSLLHMNGGDLHESHFEEFLQFEEKFNKSKNIPDDVVERFMKDSFILPLEN